MEYSPLLALTVFYTAKHCNCTYCVCKYSLWQNKKNYMVNEICAFILYIYIFNEAVSWERSHIFSPSRDVSSHQHHLFKPALACKGFNIVLLMRLWKRKWSGHYLKSALLIEEEGTCSWVWKQGYSIGSENISGVSDSLWFHNILHRQTTVMKYVWV